MIVPLWPHHSVRVNIQTYYAMPDIKTIFANCIAKAQSSMLRSGWVIVRDNPCRKRARSLGQEKYFETFDYVRLAQLELLACHLEHFSIAGHCAEVGVYRGYFAQKIREFLPGRKLYLFDTFEGFDQRDLDVEQKVSTHSAKDDFSGTSVDAVISIIQGDDIIVRKGFFPGTAEDSDGPFALVSMDVDLYQPTLEGLRFFFPRMSPGGVILVHDYNNTRYPAVRNAVHEFFADGVGFVPIPDKNGSVLIIKPH